MGLGLGAANALAETGRSNAQGLGEQRAERAEGARALMSFGLAMHSALTEHQDRMAQLQLTAQNAEAEGDREKQQLAIALMNAKTNELRAGLERTAQEWTQNPTNPENVLRTAQAADLRRGPGDDQEKSAQDLRLKLLQQGVPGEQVPYFETVVRTGQPPSLTNPPATGPLTLSSMGGGAMTPPPPPGAFNPGGAGAGGDTFFQRDVHGPHPLDDALDAAGLGHLSGHGLPPGTTEEHIKAAAEHVLPAIQQHMGYQGAQADKAQSLARNTDARTGMLAQQEADREKRTSAYVRNVDENIKRSEGYLAHLRASDKRATSALQNLESWRGFLERLDMQKLTSGNAIAWEKMRDSDAKWRAGQISRYDAAAGQDARAIEAQITRLTAARSGSLADPSSTAKIDAQLQRAQGALDTINRERDRMRTELLQAGKVAPVGPTGRVDGAARDAAIRAHTRAAREAQPPSMDDFMKRHGIAR